MTQTSSSRTAVLLSLLLAAERVSAFAPPSNKHNNVPYGSNSAAVLSKGSSAVPTSATQLFSGMMGGGNGYSNQRREEIVAFQVTTVFDQEELLARERDQPMFTPAVRRDIYRILRSPYNPSLGDGPPQGPNMFGSVLLAKSSDNNGPNAAWDTFAFAGKGANPSGFVMLDDEQMLEAISSIGKITPVALAITQAFEAYLSQVVQLYWGEPEAAQLSVEFLVAFGNELTQRLDVNNRIRSTRLTPQEIEVLYQQPFANFVDSESLENFQGETMRGMNLDAIRSAPPPEIIPLAGNYGNSDLGVNARPNNGPAYNSNSNNNNGSNNPYGRNPPGNNGSNNSYGGGNSNNNNNYGGGNNPYGQSQPPPPRQNSPMPQQQQQQQPGYNSQNNNMDFNRHNDNNNGYNPNGRSPARGNTYSGNTNDSRNFGSRGNNGNDNRNNNNNFNGSYGGMPDQGRPLQGRTDGYNQNANANNNNNNQYGNNNDGIRSNSKMRGYDNANGGMNNNPDGGMMNNNPNGMNNNPNGMMNNNPNGSYGNNRNNNNGSPGPGPGPGYGNNNNNPQIPYGDNRGPPMQSTPPDNFGNDMNFNGGNNNNNNGGNNNNNSYNNGGNNDNNNNNNNYGNNNNNNNNNGGTNTYGNGNGLYESARRGAKRDNALWDDNSRDSNSDRGWYENL